MRKLLNISLAISVALTSSLSHAAKFDIAKVVGRASQIIKTSDDGSSSVGFDFFIMNDETAWVRALYPENQRYVKYGPWTIDRNKPNQIFNLHRFFGAFEHNGNAYLVGMPKPYVSEKIEGKTKTEVFPLEPVLYKVMSQHGKIEHSYIRNLTMYGIGAAIYFGVATGLNSFLPDPFSMSMNNLFGGFLMIVSTIGGTFLSYAAISPTIAKGEVIPNSEKHVLGPKISQNQDDDEEETARALPIVRKIDTRLPFTANNITIVFEGRSARPFLEIDQGLECSSMLSFRPAKHQIVTGPGGFSEVLE